MKVLKSLFTSFSNHFMCCFILFWFSASGVLGQTDTLQVENRSKGKEILDKLYQRVKAFSHIDTTYVEAQKYNFTAMFQNINTYEIYQISDNHGQSVRFSPRATVKVGPYFGWRWIVWGYTVDLSHLLGGHQKQDFTLSLYSNQVGLDLFYRKTGHDYRIRSIHLDSDVDTRPLNDMAFSGVHASIKGLNLYYIFNHKRFSYPAAYSQSTRQLRSAGSVLAGFGFTKHSLTIDWQALEDLLAQHVETPAGAGNLINDDLKFSSIRYNDLSLYLGYSYNWVFAPRWLFNSSLSAGLGYKQTSGDIRNNNPFDDFSFHNFNIDGIGRFALVYNTSKWYAGANGIFHAYNYKKNHFQTNNVFGNVTLYIGYNFGKK